MKKSPFMFKENNFIEEADYHTVRKLKQESESTIARINYHDDLESILQTMLILMDSDHKGAIHRHNDKDETLTVVKGKLEILFYDDQGNIENTHLLSKNETILLKKGSWHQVRCPEGEVYFLEIANGPFRPDLTDIRD
ncbi:MAG: cupin fold metalloprotein, WbuC family [Oligoflexia bacterium]|nr:cupin fold metalloprotein, WbuC family [Oligoflexia bacterium]